MLWYVAHSCCPAILRCQDCGKSPGFQLCQVCGVEQNTSFLCLTFLIYRCDSWTTKKARCGRIDVLELWCWRRLLGIYLEETIIVKDISTPVVIATLFTVARTWKQPRCPWADEWIVSYVHIHNGILLVCKKEHIWVGSNEVDEPRTCYTEWSKSERVKQIPYINVYIYMESRMRVSMVLSTGKQKDTNIKNRLLDTVKERVKWY